MSGYGTTDSVLKPLDEVTMPDPRWEVLIRMDSEGLNQFALKDLHARVSEIHLNEKVPEGIRRQFELARNLMVYSWYVFEFHTMAQLQAYAALEFALKQRLPELPTPSKAQKSKRHPTLAPLLRKAVKSRVIDPAQLPFWQRRIHHQKQSEGADSSRTSPVESAEDWINRVVESLPYLRNTLAHGQPLLYITGAFDALELCGDLINALFEETEEKDRT